jgi:methylmalonyl-CoA mutase cobalamin-binding subunit
MVESGWSPSAAAAAILEGRAPADAMGAGHDGGSPDASAGAVDVERGLGSPAVELGEALVRAAGTMDAEAVDRVLDDLFSRGSFERVASDLLFPALRRLGDAWASGEVTVAGEHLASSAVHRRLGHALESAGSADRAGVRLVVGLPPGGRHELGALAFAVAARRAGLAVSYLGADLPATDWVGAVDGADAAVIGVVTGRDRRAALEVARAIRAAAPAIVVAFGGAAAPEEPGVLRLGESLTEAVGAVSRALAG